MEVRKIIVSKLVNAPYRFVCEFLDQETIKEKIDISKKSFCWTNISIKERPDENLDRLEEILDEKSIELSEKYKEYCILRRFMEFYEKEKK